jgi:hypothetical protein
MAMKPFDERLFTLKLHEPSKRIQLQTATRLHQVDAGQRAIGQARGTAWLVKRVDAAIGVFREFVPEIDKACRETWLSDDNSITPEFIRGVLVPHVFTIMAARKGAIHGDLELLARRVGIGTELTPALHHLVHEANRLQSDVATHYEIEAIELFKKESQARKVTQALPPPHEVSGLGISHSHAKSARIPPNPPAYFPTDLWPKTVVILAETVKKFPDRGKQMPDLCRQYISDMTPIFYEAVENGRLKSGAVLSEDLGGMQDLLRSLLVYNDDGPHSGFGGLSNEAYRIYQEARNSEEWLKLARAITDAKREASSSVGTRTKRSSGAQENANSSQDVKHKPERGNPEVAKRAVIVRSNPSASADEMCAIFDRENVPLPRKWLDAGFSTWIKAYKNSSYRSRIQTLISKNRRRKN